jgi:hypothetical protein
MSFKRRASSEPVEVEEERKRAKTVEVAEVNDASATTQPTNAPEPKLEGSNEAASENKLPEDNLTPDASLQAPDTEANLRPTNPDPDLRKLIPELSQTFVRALVLQDFNDYVPNWQPIWNYGSRVFNLSRIELENTHVDARVLAGIIGSCTALKELIYVWHDKGRNSQVEDCRNQGADLQFSVLKRH